ncbi:hypothetical protein [Citrobacter sp. FP75]|uniref:hypothetical protein n=1 Tax=Citrobacter sp. FP75 TaxID=1852949 RepID=UPI001BC94743|nr:hypothetical protein [Citrobacter sp. FP75]
MALTVCKECKKEVSSTAKTCPHCGVSSPAVIPPSKKEAAGGCLILVVLAIIVCWLWSSCSSDKSDTTKTADAEKDVKTCAATDGQCLFNKEIGAAIVQCVPLVERSAKFDFEWTDGVLEQKFSRFILDSKKGQLTYFGDKVKFSNGFNAKTTMTYSCTIDLKTEGVVDFKIKQGRL